MSWAHVHAGSTPATRTIFSCVMNLRRGSSVGQYERLITSKRRCKSCPRNQVSELSAEVNAYRIGGVTSEIANDPADVLLRISLVIDTADK